MNDEEELFGINVDDIDVLIDEETGDVGLRTDRWPLLIMTPALAAELARALATATRRGRRPALTPAQWVAAR